MSRLMIGDVTLNVIQKGQGRPLLLVHGFPLDHRMWQGQIDDLAEDFQVIAPDLRGFGDSDASTGVVSMQQYADDLARLLDQLGIPQKVVFCGLSMGGYIAWQFWRRHGDRLSHLVLCDTRSAADAPDVAQTRLETAERVLQEGTALLVESMIPKLFSERTRQQNPSTVMATAKVIAAAQPVGVAAALRGMAQRVERDRVATGDRLANAGRLRTARRDFRRARNGGNRRRDTCRSVRRDCRLRPYGAA